MRHALGGGNEVNPQYGMYEPPETGYPCPICGYEVDRRREEWGYDEDWQICHEICLNGQEEEAWETA